MLYDNKVTVYDLRIYMKITNDMAKKIAKDLKLDMKGNYSLGNNSQGNTQKFNLSDFKQGLKVELEHGPKKKGGVSSKTNVTGGNLLKTGKIVLAHLDEDPKYYSKLAIMEKKNKK